MKGCTAHLNVGHGGKDLVLVVTDDSARCGVIVQPRIQVGDATQFMEGIIQSGVVSIVGPLLSTTDEAGNVNLLLARESLRGEMRLCMWCGQSK